MSYDPFTGLPHPSGIDGGVSKGVSFSVDDDAVAVIKMPKDTGIIMITETEGHGQLMAFGDTDAPSLTEFVAAGGVYTLTTGALTGTTGVDGEQTVSVHTDEFLYIENRSGVTRNYVVSILNQGAIL